MPLTITPSIEALLPSLGAELSEPPFVVTNHSLVYASTSQRFRGRIALKIIDKKALPVHIADKFLPRELDITRKVQHPHVLKCLHIESPTPTKLVIVSEYCAKGTLLQQVISEGRLKETPSGVRLFRQLIEAVKYLHDRSIVHRDIKLENILLDINGDIRLGDFGFARFIDRRKRSGSFCGTRPYSAPQLVKHEAYDSYAADWYSVGVVLYTAVVGKWPKEPNGPIESMITFPSDVPSGACRRLIMRLLDEDEMRRAGYSECVHSEWMAAQPSWVFADTNFVYTALRSI